MIDTTSKQSFVLITITFIDNTDVTFRCDMQRKTAVEFSLDANPPLEFFEFTDNDGVFHAFQRTQIRIISSEVVIL